MANMTVAEYRALAQTSGATGKKTAGHAPGASASIRHYAATVAHYREEVTTTEHYRTTRVFDGNRLAEERVEKLGTRQ